MRIDKNAGLKNVVINYLVNYSTKEPVTVLGVKLEFCANFPIIAQIDAFNLTLFGKYLQKIWYRNGRDELKYLPLTI